MPKIVDHAQRRAELAAAVWRVVERAGTEGATVRSVAAEAGVSPSALRHYFADQGQLLLFAADAVGQRVGDRIMAALATEESGLDRAQRLLEQLLPLDAERRVEAAMWLAFLSRARFDERLAAMKAAAWLGERHICRLALACLTGKPLPIGPEEIFASAVDEATVQWLHTFIDGLTLQASTFAEQLGPKQVRHLLRELLLEMQVAG